MSPERLRPLPTVLGEIGFHHRRAVLMQGRNYWPIADLLKQARRDLKSGPERDRAALSAPEYRWEDTAEGGIVVRHGPTGRAVFAEPGSPAVAET